MKLCIFSVRKWQPTPVFLLGKSHGQRRLVGYSPWGHKELDMTEGLTLLLASNKYQKILQYLLKLSLTASNIKFQKSNISTFYYSASPLIIFFKYLFNYFWLHWAFVAAPGLSLVAELLPSCSAQASHCSGFSCCGA